MKLELNNSYMKLYDEGREGPCILYGVTSKQDSITKNKDKNNIPSQKNSKSHIENSNVNNTSLSFSKQEGEDAMIDGARSTWNRSRNAAVDASKAKIRATFYLEAPKKDNVEYWCLGLEKTPGYLIKLAPFRTIEE